MAREIERFQTPGIFEDAILLVVSAGLSDFIRNTLASIERSGAAEVMICIALPRNAFSEVQIAVSPWENVKYFFLEDIRPADYSWIREYHEYGSEGFHRFTVLSKWSAIRFLLESGFRRVTYTDVDIAWMRNPMPLLRTALQTYEMAVQTDGTDRFPPVYCSGFMSFRNSAFTIGLLDKCEESYRDIVKIEPKVGDQSVLNRVIAASDDMIQRVFCLSEQLFANGLMAGAIASQEDYFAEVLKSRINAMIFHANWSIGLESKRVLLHGTGNWLLDESGTAARMSHRELGTGGNLLAELDATRRQLSATQNELDAIRNQLDAVYASTSWRLTEPLRRVLRRLRPFESPFR
jgi:hypothetical protein